MSEVVRVGLGLTVCGIGFTVIICAFLHDIHIEVKRIANSLERREKDKT